MKIRPVRGGFRGWEILGSEQAIRPIEPSGKASFLMIGNSNRPPFRANDLDLLAEDEQNALGRHIGIEGGTFTMKRDAAVSA